MNQLEKNGEDVKGHRTLSNNNIFLKRGDNMEFQSSKRTREVIIEMLKEYPLNCEKYSRIKEDETIREWKLDYMTRQGTGGLKAGGIGTLYPLSRTYSNKYASIEEALLLEKENVLDRIYELNIQIQIVKLLILSLREDMVKLVDLRYFKRKTVRFICSELYCSRSTFYRKNNEILDYLAVEYEQLFLRSKDKDKGMPMKS